MVTLEDLLAQCLDDLAKGSSVEECLARYPQWRDELKPLLLTAQRIHTAPRVVPSPAFRQVARTRMLNLIQAEAPVEHRSRGVVQVYVHRILQPFLNIPTMARHLSAPILASLLLVASMIIGGGVVYASGDSLPGDILYPVKLTTEQVQLTLSLYETGDAQLHLKFAGERVREAVELAARSKIEGVDTPINRYVRQMITVCEIVEKQAERGEHSTSLGLLLLDDLVDHQMALARLRERLPEEAGLALQEAMVASGAVQERVLEVIKEREPAPMPEPTSVPELSNDDDTESDTGNDPEDDDDKPGDGSDDDDHKVADEDSALVL